MTPTHSLNRSFQNLTSPIIQSWQKLSRRDQLALGLLVAFLVVFIVGFGGWTLHEKATNAKKSYDDTMADVFWLRSQAGNINPNQTQALNKADLVKQILAQSGISDAQVVENADTIQLVFNNSQASVVSNIFNQFHQQGISINQLHINQPSVDKLEVQATLSSK